MRKNILITIITLLFASCSKDEVPVPEPEPVKVERTIIAYMAADNNLWDVVYVDIEEMKQGYVETGVNLIVLKQQITNKKFKVLSQVDAIKNKMKQSANEIEEIITVPVIAGQMSNFLKQHIQGASFWILFRKHSRLLEWDVA